MTGSTRPDEIRTTSFDQSLRGYDREEVERFRDAVADEIEALLARIAHLETGASALGIEDAESLRAELATVGDDIAEILATAQRAAEGIRSRAAADAATWRADADAEARAARTQAQRDSEKARGDAWETASALLEQAQRTAGDMLDAAAEDALFVRAEAEREALRLTGDARRDQDEILRKARLDADRTVDAARVESAQILEAARQSAESAQERARALERRRAELMEELEAARMSIGQLEQEIDTRREALATAADGPDSGVRIVGVGDEFGWHEDDTSVRVVPAHVAPVDEPVDADSLVAEVEALQAAIEAVAAPPEGEPVGVEPAEPDAVEAGDAGDAPPLDSADTGDTATEPADDVAPHGPGDVEPVEAGPVDVGPAASGAAVAAPLEPGTEPDTATERPDPDGAEPADGAEPGDSAEPGDGAEPAGAEPAGAEPADGAGAPAGAGPPGSGVPEAASEPARTAELDNIFARLREPRIEAAVAAPRDEDDGVATAADEAGGEAVELPVERSVAERADRGEPLPAARPATGVDPFALRDRILLPIENRALRSVKRRIVDLQNRVLEELRIGGDDWVPDRALLAASVGDEMTTIAAESHVAGHSASADLTGSTTTPRPERGPSTDDSAAFVDALERAVTDALARARTTGGGSRQVAAGVGRVFRAWRTDEAERRVRAAARSSYNEGVLAGLQLLGVERVIAVAAGSPCGDCPAATGVAWRPGDELPRGTTMPPAGPSCTATIVPAE